MSKPNSKIRIRRARAWLTVNTKWYCAKFNKPFREKKWLNSLLVYEQLVDDCPIPEVECLSYEGIKSQDMEPYEVEYMMFIDNQSVKDVQLGI